MALATLATASSEVVAFSVFRDGACSDDLGLLEGNYTLSL
jgi:hypothetical protein